MPIPSVEADELWPDRSEGAIRVRDAYLALKDFEAGLKRNAKGHLVFTEYEATGYQVLVREYKAAKILELVIDNPLPDNVVPLRRPDV